MDDNSTDSLPVGATIGKFKIVEIIGAGGTGIVYKVQDPFLDVIWAIKEFFPRECAYRGPNKEVVAFPNRDADLALLRAKFLEEAKIVAELKSVIPNSCIVEISDYFLEYGNAYIRMKYERGVSLERYLKDRGHMDQAEMEKMFEPLLEGLELIHQRNIWHRDIKPSNILVREDGSPVLIDFGAVRIERGQAESRLVQYSPLYAAPEQTFGKDIAGRQGAWTDVYGIGATMYQAMTRQPPPPVLTTADGSYASFPDETRQRYTETYCDTVQRAICFDSKLRPQSAGEMLKMLRADRKADSQTAATAESNENKPQVGKIRWGYVAAIPLALSVVIGAGYYTVTFGVPEFLQNSKDVPAPLVEVVQPPQTPSSEEPYSAATTQIPKQTQGEETLESVEVSEVPEDEFSGALPQEELAASIEEVVTPVSDTIPNTGLEMVYIPGGCFGTEPTCVDDFRISSFEVSVGEFQRFIASSGYRTTAERSGQSGETGCKTFRGNDWQSFRGSFWESPGFPQAANHPVVCVSLEDAFSFVNWLSEETGRSLRLPTEAEWEYAARAGATTNYFWGETIVDGAANYIREPCPRDPENLRHVFSKSVTCTRGSFPPNDWGIYDASGNVTEWTCSPYVDRSSLPSRDCIQDLGSSNNGLITKGGSWNDGDKFLQLSARDVQRANDNTSFLGFRIVEDVSEGKITHRVSTQLR